MAQQRQAAVHHAVPFAQQPKRLLGWLAWTQGQPWRAQPCTGPRGYGVGLAEAAGRGLRTPWKLDVQDDPRAHLPSNLSPVEAALGTRPMGDRRGPAPPHGGCGSRRHLAATAWMASSSTACIAKSRCTCPGKLLATRRFAAAHSEAPGKASTLTPRTPLCVYIGTAAEHAIAMRHCCRACRRHAELLQSMPASPGDAPAPSHSSLGMPLQSMLGRASHESD